MSFLGIALFPFTLLYDMITRFRNYLYDSGYKTSFRFQANVIAVGNLSVGGTGKSPLVEYIIRLLRDKNVVTLSRGYGRETRGFRIASHNDTPKTIGDEPYQFYNKFKDIYVTVGERRAIAIPFILAELPETEVILLDDAFQHRPVDPSLNILLTDYQKPFFKDHVLPSGRLRERRRGAGRADVIVVTKCPPMINDDVYEQEIRKYNANAHIAFSTIKYLEPVKISGKADLADKVFLFSGIANPEPLKEYVSSQFQLVGEHYFRDHYRYTTKDIKELKAKIDAIGDPGVVLLTTEKDMVKLMPLINEVEVNDMNIFYLPIETVFVKGGRRFDELVVSSIKHYEPTDVQGNEELSTENEGA